MMVLYIPDLKLRLFNNLSLSSDLKVEVNIFFTEKNKEKTPECKKTQNSIFKFFEFLSLRHRNLCFSLKKKNISLNNLYTFKDIGVYLEKDQIQDGGWLTNEGLDLAIFFYT
jgi:hypothetical protein